MECKQCGNEFESKRATAQYCSAKCRVTANRVNVTEFATVGVSVTDVPKVSVTKLSVTRPPCTPDQLTSSCLACKDKPDCSYLHNMNSAVPGDAEYAGVI